METIPAIRASQSLTQLRIIGHMWLYMQAATATPTITVSIGSRSIHHHPMARVTSHGPGRHQGTGPSNMVAKSGRSAERGWSGRSTGEPVTGGGTRPPRKLARWAALSVAGRGAGL